VIINTTSQTQTVAASAARRQVAYIRNLYGTSAWKNPHCNTPAIGRHIRRS
jgi:hypothetical protein